MKQFSCNDVMSGCSWNYTSHDHQQLLAAIREHVRSAHGIEELTPELVSTVEGTFKDVG
jgi:predicted small metal-binding protein